MTGGKIMIYNLFKTLKFYCKFILVVVCKLFTSIIPKDKNLIMCSSWFGKKYLDSPRYMYEYLLSSSSFDVYWFTKNKELYMQLKREGKPVVYAYSITGIIKQLRTKLFISSVEFYDFNYFTFGRSILLDLNHGFPIKQSGFEIPTYNKRQQAFDKMLRKGVSLYKTASSDFVKTILCRAEDVSSSQIIFCNKPRIDAFYDASLREGNNKIVDRIKGDKKAIVYMPTHRMAGAVPINIEEILDLDSLEKLCKEINAVFIIKKHYYHLKEKTDLSKYSHIFDISHENIEIQTLLYQADVLISDYSAAYIDFLVLDRPIIFYAYDYEDYIKNERNLYIKFDDIDAGYKAYKYEQLHNALKQISSRWTDNEHAEGRRHLRSYYFDTELPKGTTREHIKTIIEELISEKYEPKWK